MEVRMKTSLRNYTTKALEECTTLELFNALLQYTGDVAKERGYNEGKKKLYYISAEFLIGKLLSNNLINLGCYDAVKEELAAAGRNLSELEEFESEPSLGNGGLGRLAACFMDSCATLGLPASGVGLAYHCGLFRQSFQNRKQCETPDYWLHFGQESFLHRTDRHYDVHFGDFTLRSTMYELDVTGFQSRSGCLQLFDIDTLDERLIHNEIDFDKTKIPQNLTLFLYPDDGDDEGRLLRVYQEYFMVSNAAQLLLDECVGRGSNLHDLPDYAAVQINDTHPTMVIPELIRLLVERGIVMEEAIEIVRKVCAYTNHTILAEALETWPLAFLEKAVPQLLPILRHLDRLVKDKYEDPFVYIIDDEERIHMANLDIHYSHSVNGVAALHTEILKNTELHPFYEIYPEKFNNKTNGITFRRWLMECDPALAELITGTIGDGWQKDAMELKKLLEHRKDETLLRRIVEIKKENKKLLADWLYKHQGARLNPETVFDVQSKRLHEYKRQQLNLLWAIRTYLDIKNGTLPASPVTVIFGAKAAPAYTIAKDIIHAILCFSKIVEEDPEVRPYLHVVMVENYNITAAEKLIPACDISEQISLASKEASGTGNMKFMLNGAITLGTMDGANVEIAELVGRENIYAFGASSDEVIQHYAKADYVSMRYYRKDKALKAAVDFLTGKEMRAVGDAENLERLRHELLHKDWFMTFLDFTDYCETKARMLADIRDEMNWAEKMLVNIANAGFFSSDRTIAQYEEEIWKLR